MQCFIDIGFHWHCFWRSLFSDIFCKVLLKWFHLRHLEIYITLQVVPDSPLFACTGCNTNDSVIVVSGDCCRAGGFQEVGRRCGVLNTLLSHEVTGWHATRRTGRGCRLPHGENWDAGEDGVVPSAELSQNSGKVRWRWFCLYHRSAECLWNVSSGDILSLGLRERLVLPLPQIWDIAAGWKLGRTEKVLVNVERFGLSQEESEIWNCWRKKIEWGGGLTNPSLCRKWSMMYGQLCCMISFSVVHWCVARHVLQTD